MRKVAFSLSFALFAAGPSAFCDSGFQLTLPKRPGNPDMLVLKKLDTLVNPERDPGSVSLTVKAANGLPKDDAFCIGKIERLTFERVPDFLSGLEVVATFAL